MQAFIKINDSSFLSSHLDFVTYTLLACLAVSPIEQSKEADGCRERNSHGY